MRYLGNFCQITAVMRLIWIWKLSVFFTQPVYKVTEKKLRLRSHGTGSVLGRLLRPDIVQFHFACLGTEIFLRELTLSSTLSSNPKSSRSVDLQFLHKLLFYLHKFYDKFFIVQRHRWMKIHDYVTQKDQFLLTSLLFNKRPFCPNHFELFNFMRVRRKQHILSTTLRRHR